jgi:hypothetical protein
MIVRAEACLSILLSKRALVHLNSAKLSLRPSSEILTRVNICPLEFGEMFDRISQSAFAPLPPFFLRRTPSCVPQAAGITPTRRRDHPRAV